MTVVIGRKGREAYVDEIRNDPLLQAAIEEGRVTFADPDEETHHLSSTLARADGTGLHPEVEDNAHGFRGRNRPASTTGVYILFDDLEWATRQWEPLTDPNTLREAKNEFTSGLKKLFTEHLPSGVTLETVEDKTRLPATDPGLPLVSLDALCEIDHHLHISRVFALSSFQRKAIEVAPRPGYPALEDQLDALSHLDEIVLCDDDSSTGLMFDHAGTLLRERQINVRDTVTFLEGVAREPVFDVVDMRDFLWGSRDGGLVVRYFDGTIIRAPYMLPFVSLSTRAKIPVTTERELSRRILALNSRFFDKTGTRVMDTDPNARALLTAHGFHPGMRMGDVCRDPRVLVP